jgi:hypothetical protein
MFTRSFGSSANNSTARKKDWRPGGHPPGHIFSPTQSVIGRIHDAGFGGYEDSRVRCGVLHIGLYSLARKAIEQGNFRYLNFLLADELRPPHVLRMAGSAATSLAEVDEINA